MQFISSDTSVWIDFSTIKRMQLPFKLPYTYIMSKDAVEEELLSPPGLGLELKGYGLIPVEITIEEFYLAQEYANSYKRLSKHDCTALAIAKERKITLLTGDKALRSAAIKEDVDLIGTLGILDQLYSNGIINDKELKECLEALKKNNGGAVRLPESEIDSRLAMLFGKT